MTACFEQAGSWLLLHDDNDLDALWLSEGLTQRGLLGLERVSTTALMTSRPWVYRAGLCGAEAEVTLGSGRRIASSQVRGVINRVLALPMGRFDDLPDADRGYAQQEFVAFFVAWLGAFPQVVNRSTTSGLCGAWRTFTEWSLLAHRAGLPTRARVVTSEDHQSEHSTGEPVTRVLVVGPQVISQPAVRGLGNKCRALAALADTVILEIDFIVDRSGQASFYSASPLPQLRWAGPQAIEAIYELLVR